MNGSRIGTLRAQLATASPADKGRAPSALGNRRD
jgi:hypothetical protein